MRSIKRIPTDPKFLFPNGILQQPRYQQSKYILAEHPILEVEKQIYRPKLPSKYLEYDDIPDTLDSMDILFKDYGDSIRRTTIPLPPRDNIIHFSEAEQAEYDKNIKWYDCPPEHQVDIKVIIKEYWDVFVEHGLCRPIRGFEFHIETGPVKPICVSQPWYGPHEARIIDQQVAALEANV
jgi:hypothetical protein